MTRRAEHARKFLMILTLALSAAGSAGASDGSIDDVIDRELNASGAPGVA
jgi:hypothetical protein